MSNRLRGQDAQEPAAPAPAKTRKRKTPASAASSSSSSSSSSVTADPAQLPAKQQKVTAPGPVIKEGQWEDNSSEQKHDAATPGHDDDAAIDNITLLTQIILITLITLITLKTLITLICQVIDKVSTEDCGADSQQPAHRILPRRGIWG